MKNEPFVIERLLDAPVDRVWKALTDRNQLKEWYFDLSGFKPEPGSAFEFEGGTIENKYLHKCQVMEVLPERKISYTWRYDGYEGNSLVIFELFPVGKKTRIKLTHEGLESFPQDNPDFARKNFAEGWGQIIGSMLPAFLEKEVSV